MRTCSAEAVRIAEKCETKEKDFPENETGSFLFFVRIKSERGMKMTQEVYTIGDVAKRIQVETHVLRYWEEELGLSIGRNELGHRYYTEDDMKLMENIRQWKEQGLQLKAIRLMLSGDGKLSVPAEVVREAQAMVERPSGEGDEGILLDARGSKAARLQLLLENLVSKAVQENSRVILKELDFQFRQMEENAQAREEKRKEREEEHYRKLDELICQRGRRKGKRKKHPGTKF